MKFKFIYMLVCFSISLLANNLKIETKYLVDNHQYTINTIYNNKDKFTQMDDNSFGLINETIWIYIKIDNKSNTSQNNIIQMPYVLLDNIHVLKYEKNSLVQNYLTGDLQSFDTREIKTNDFIIPYTIKPNDSIEIILKINTQGAYNLGMNFMSLDEYHLNSKEELIGLGFYYGATIIMLFYNFILFLMIKDRVYMDYIVFHFVFLFLQLGLNGLAFQYIWPTNPEFNIYYVPIALVAANYFSIQFSQSFLELLEKSKIVYNYFTLLKIFWIITLILIFITPYAFSIKIIAGLSLLSITTLFFASLYILYKYRTISSKFYVAAWSCILIGTLATELQNIGVISVNSFTLYGSQIGAFFELALLSFALAYRYNTLFLKLTHTESNLRILNKNLEQNVMERTKDLANKQEQLQELNNSLEDKIREAINDTKNKEKMLQQQTKLASMGEMISNIAHQWRQPLAVSNTIVSILKEQSNRDILSKEYTHKKLDEIESNNLYMSQTIEDFLSFFNPKKQKEKFEIQDAIDKSLTIINNLISKNKIQIKQIIENKLKINGFKDEYIQVILSILTNAIYALEKKELQEKLKQIIISAYTKDDLHIVEISDNAGGIPENIIDRIFEPYFTTKHKNKGTGLGLYISKMIIEKSMHGTLNVENTNIGAKFTICCN